MVTHINFTEAIKYSFYKITVNNIPQQKGMKNPLVDHHEIIPNNIRTILPQTISFYYYLQKYKLSRTPFILRK